MWEQQGVHWFHLLRSLKNLTIGLIWLVTRAGGVGGVGQGGGQGGVDGGGHQRAVWEQQGVHWFHLLGCLIWLVTRGRGVGGVGQGGGQGGVGGRHQTPSARMLVSYYPEAANRPCVSSALLVGHEYWSLTLSGSIPNSANRARSHLASLYTRFGGTPTYNSIFLSLDRPQHATSLVV